MKITALKSFQLAQSTQRNQQIPAGTLPKNNLGEVASNVSFGNTESFLERAFDNLFGSGSAKKLIKKMNDWQDNVDEKALNEWLNESSEDYSKRMEKERNDIRDRM